MRIIFVAFGLAAVIAVRSDSPVRQVTLDPEAKTYVFDSHVADDLRLCIKIEPDQHLACVSAGQIRAIYRGKR